MRNLHTRSAFLALLAGIALALPGLAQSETPGVFSEIIDVRVVNVEVVVVDKQGNRVPGLKPEDFRLRVDGAEVPIEYFTEVFGGQAVLPEAGSAAQGVPAVSPGKPVGTSYLVFIDEYFTVVRDRNRVLRGLKDQLNLMAPEDRMAVVAFDGHQLDMLATWSQSPGQITAVLEEALRRPSHGLQRVAERRTLGQSLRTGTGSLDRVQPLGRFLLDRRLDADELYYAQLISDQVQRVVSAAAATLRSFAAPPGRKVMVLLAGEWPFFPAEFAVNDFERPLLDREVTSGPDLFAPLTDTANRLGYTLYPVDVAGIQGNLADASRSASFDPLASPLLNTEFVRETEVHSAYSFLAERTGGRALLNSMHEITLERVASDTRSYYWLGFTPTWRGDDEHHKIELEVLRPGLKARSRRNFLDLSRKSEVTMMVESALLFGNAPSSQPLGLKLGKAERSGRSKVQVPLTITIPVDKITLLPKGQEYVAELELRIAAMDQRGDRAEIPVVPIRISGPRQPEPGQFLSHQLSLELRRMHHDLVVAVFDPVSGTLLSATTEFEP